MQSRLTQLGLKDVFEKDSDGFTILHHTCREGKLQTVQHLIEYFPDLMKIRDKTGCSLLLISGLSGSVELVKHLISKGCNVTDKDNDGETVLHKACNEGYKELVQYLVVSYPDILTIRDKWGQSPFLVSGYSGSVELVKYLISKGCDVMYKDNDGETILYKACDENKLELVKYLVEKCPELLTMRDEDGQSPILVAGKSGSVELVKYLIAKQCDVLDQDDNGLSVLHYACKVGNTEVVQYIVENYQDVLTIRNKELLSPFIVAGFSGSVELIKYLISKECDVLDKDNGGITVLHYASLGGNTEIVQYLVDNYPELLTMRDKDGQSPFLVAGISGSLELVKYLISMECDVMDKDNDGETVLYKACKRWGQELVKYLVENYPELLTIRDEEGQSPFLVTGVSGSVELVKYLISKQCDVLDKDSDGWTVLHKACKYGKLELVKYLVENYPELLTIRDKEGQSSFLVAGQSGSVELVEYLISKGCDALDKDNNGLTVLHYACQKGNTEVVQYLVENSGELLTMRHEDGQSPFLVAGFSGSVELVKYLISRGCDVMDKDNDGWTVLHYACQEGEQELVQYLVENYPILLTMRDKEGQSPFLVVGISGSVELVEYLISKGCDVLDNDNDGKTILYTACNENKLELVKYLVEKSGELLTMRQEDGQSPFLVAGLSGSVELVKYLLSKGCYVLDKDNNGLTVLHYACKEGNTEVVQYLVENYQDVLTMRDKELSSPFHVAGLSGSVELVKYLISKGCEVMDKDNDGWTVLHYACKEGNTEVVQYLVENYPELLTMRDKELSSPFPVAGLSGSVELVKYLISKGCEVMDKDNDGWTVLHQACNEGKLDLVQYLVDNYPEMLTIRDKSGQSPFLVTGYSCSVDLVTYLIAKGCDVMDMDNDGETILYNACKEGKLESVQYLVENYPDLLKIKNKIGQSPFVVSGVSGSKELVKYLISRGCDVMDKDNHERNILHITCNNGNLELAQYLAGSFPNMLTNRDKWGLSSYLFSGFSGSVELVKYLISRGCDVIDKDNNGETVLHNACKKRNFELVQYLVESYPDMLTIRNKEGQSPFHVAESSRSDELVNYLISRGCDEMDKNND